LQRMEQTFTIQVSQNHETRDVMSETVIENVEQVPEKKKWKASTVRIAFAIFILIPFVAVWAGMQNIDSLVIVDFLFFFGLAMYGKISGKLETSASNSSFELSPYEPNYQAATSSDYTSYTPNYGMPGYNVSGVYTGSDTARGGISN